MKKNRFVAILLSVMMLLQCMPMNALADSLTQDGAMSSVQSDVLRAANYTITFSANGAVVDVLEMAAGGRLSESDIPQAPQLEGNRFIRWMDESGATVEAGYEPSADMTITAEYKEEFTVTYVVDGETFTTDTVLKDEPIGTLPNAPDKMNSTFVGWFVGETQMTAESTFSENVTATARYNDDLIVRFLVDGDAVHAS